VLFLVLTSLVQLLHEPEPEHPLRGDLAEEYTRDKKKFYKNAEEYTKKYSEKRPADLRNWDSKNLFYCWRNVSIYHI